MPRAVPLLLFLLLLLLLTATVAGAGVEDVTDYGSHPVRHAGAREAAGIATVELVRERGAYTGRLLAPGGEEVAVLRMQWLGDGTAQIEMEGVGGTWSGVWREESRRLEMTDLETGEVAVGRRTASGWALVEAPAGEEERWGAVLAVMGWGFAESDLALGLAAWE